MTSKVKNFLVVFDEFCTSKHRSLQKLQLSGSYMLTRVNFPIVLQFRYGGLIRPRARRNTWGDSDVILMLAGFRRHLVGKNSINIFHCDITEIRLVGKLVIIQTVA